MLKRLAAIRWRRHLLEALLVVVVIVAMQSGDAAAVAQHLKQRNLAFSSLADPDGALAAQWKVRGVPTHFIVDGQGQVRFRVVGYATTLGLRARLWWAQRFPA